MATLILGTVGRIVGGPIGGLIGTFAGGLVDRSLFGGGNGGGRLGNLEVQSAAYGEPIPIIVGRMRAAGNLIWSSGIAESHQGGSKGGGAGYSYSASFAVALAKGPIIDVGRIWADGTEIRSAAGLFANPVTMRLYRGDEAQGIDPLIAAAEGQGATPAYRGTAYAVFESLALGDFGNRIPNLTFEVIADLEADIGIALRALVSHDGEATATVVGRFPGIDGYAAARAGSIADSLAPLIEICGAAIAPASVSGSGPVVAGNREDYVDLVSGECQARQPDADNGRDRQIREGGERAIDAVEIGYLDSGRDYQPGLQRVRRGTVGMLAHRTVSGAMAATQAKQLAATILARTEAARLQTSARLPWRHIGITPGMQVRLSDDNRIWRVRATRFEAFVVRLELERAETLALPDRAADAGRATAQAIQPAGATTLHWLDLPPLPGELPVSPRLWIAAAGAAPGWRRAPIAISLDQGYSYRTIGTVEGAAAQGFAVTALPAGNTTGWDRFASVEVELLSDAMWLQPAIEAAVLAGANLALIGQEIVQFVQSEMLAPRRFRLSGLLRGRQGSEAAVAGHTAGERFIMLDRAGLLAVDMPADSIGMTVLARATGSGDAETGATACRVGGNALLPLSPAHLRLRRVGNDIVAKWVRRSRSGFGWSDFVDAPLAEASEAYRVEIRLDGVLVLTAATALPEFIYSDGDRANDDGGSLIEMRVSQLSAVAGPGAAAVASLAIA